jgi:hypothetical protein
MDSQLTDNSNQAVNDALILDENATSLELNPSLNNLSISSESNAPLSEVLSEYPLILSNNNNNTFNQTSEINSNINNNNDTQTENPTSSPNNTATTTTNNNNNIEIAHFDRTLVVIVHFLIVVAESLKYCSPEENFKLKKLVYELVKLNPKNSKKSTLLHLAASRESSSVIKNHILSSFPSTEALKLLLECGSDSNAVDSERNTALHLAASNRNFPSLISSIATNVPPIANPNPNPPSNPIDINNQNNNEETAANNNNVNPVLPTQSSPTSGNISSERDKIICILLNAKTHLDACNIHGKTAADLYKGGKMFQVINPINYLNLQCLAAKVIQKNKIPYKEHLTSKLANFVSMH